MFSLFHEYEQYKNHFIPDLRKLMSAKKCVGGGQGGRGCNCPQLRGA